MKRFLAVSYDAFEAVVRGSLSHRPITTAASLLTLWDALRVTPSRAQSSFL